MRTNVAGIAVGAAAAVVLACSAHGAGERDLQVIGRALSFIEGGPSGPVVLAVVYSDDVAGSKAEADATAAAIGGGLAAGEVTLTAQVISVAELGGSSAAAVFVPAGMSAHYGAIKAAGKVSFSTDRACVTAGGCVVAVQSEPKVEIVVNRAAAAEASVSFESAFQMMIQEI